MANTLTKDEFITAADAACETAIATLVAYNNMDRVSALRILVRRLMKKNVTNRTRVRTAQTT